MKKILLLLSYILPVLVCNGQLTSLHENFNTGCPTGTSDPNGWQTYNLVPGTSEGSWKCYPTAGRAGTPGITCSGLFGSPLKYHLDTSILISPGLNLTSYSSIYVNFDTKTSIFNLGAKLQVIVSSDSTMGADSLSTAPIYEITSGSDALVPPFSGDDETDWVTHHANLTAYKNVNPLYLGFRYISADGTYGSRWYLDNIYTTTTPYATILETSNVSQFVFTANANDGNITITYSSPISNEYTLYVCDMAGRTIHQQPVTVGQGRFTTTLPDVKLTNGFYIIRMVSDVSIATAKVAVW